MHEIGRRRPTAVRILLLVVALGLVGGFAPTRADAHAVLEASTPPDGARLQRVPTTITLRFSESVTVPSGGVKAVGPGGTSVGTGNVKTEGATVTVPLRSGLGDGGYIVSWRVISADSHPIDGGISFVVGNGAVPSKDAVSKIGGHDRPWRVAGALLRIVTYTAGALLVGGILFLTLVHEPGADARHHTRTVALAGVVTTVAALAQLVVQAALASGRGPLALFRGSIGIATAQGFGWSIGLVAFGAVAATVLVLLAEGDRKVLAFLALPMAAFVPLGWAVAGHPTTGRGAGWATLVDLAHAIAACTWVGGLALLVPTWRRHRATDDPQAAGATVRRFSAVATFSVLTVSAAGTALAWRAVRWGDLVSGTYGRLLLAKIVIAAGLVAVGAYNHFRIVPRVGHRQEDHDAAWRTLGHTLRLEAVAFVAVLAVTGVLVDVTPSRNHDRQIAIAARQVLPLGDGEVEIDVAPARAGVARVKLSLFKADGTARQVALDRLTVRFELPAERIGPITRPLKLADAGVYTADGSAMAVAGDWRVTVVARLTRFDESTATATIPVGR